MYKPFPKEKEEVTRIFLKKIRGLRQSLQVVHNCAAKEGYVKVAEALNYPNYISLEEKVMKGVFDEKLWQKIKEVELSVIPQKLFVRSIR